MAENKGTNGDRPFEVKVNGIQCEVKSRELSAREILEFAKQRGAVPGKPDEYDLQGEKDRYGPDDIVDLKVDNIFITLPTTSTPVA